jgi:hypothetical protein
MNSAKKILGTLVTVGLLATAGVASAGGGYLTSDQCQRYGATTAPTYNIGYLYTNGGSVVCPGPLNPNSSPTIDSTDVYYYSSSGYLACNWQGHDGNGNWVTSATRYSCSTAGGCTSSAQTQPGGYGYIQWTATVGAGTMLGTSAVTAPFWALYCESDGGVGHYIYGYATIFH